MSNSIINIYFCFPYQGVGGVSLLFLRCAEYLQNLGLAQCHLIDFADGFMALNKNNKNILLDIYEDDKINVYIPEDSIVVFQSMTPWSIPSRISFHKSTRVFFWNCHPFNLVPLLPGLRRQMQHNKVFSKLVLSTVLRGYRNKIRKFIEIIVQTNALVFMDNTNLQTTEQNLQLKILDPVFVPIPIEKYNGDQLIINNRDLSNKLRVTWVGRIVDFKFYTLHRALIELNRLRPLLGLSIEITIVGTGDYKESLVSAVQKLSNIKCTFLDHIPPQDLNRFLIKNTDILIAMGTSALEGASLGVPTLLLDVAYAPVSADYVFSWLHERKGYTLGEIVTAEHFISKNQTMYNCIRELTENFNRISELSRSYTYINHDLDRVIDKLLQAISSSTCTYGELINSGYLRRGFLYSLFTKIRKKVL